MDKKREIIESGIVDKLEELSFVQIRAEPISARERQQFVSRESFRKVFRKHAKELTDIVGRFSRKEISVEQAKAKTRALFINPLFADLEKEGSETLNTG